MIYSVNECRSLRIYYLPFTMYRLSSSLIILLTLFDSNNGQHIRYSQQWVQPNFVYTIENIDFPQKYQAGWSYQWIAESDRPMRFTCAYFNVPFTIRCAGDRLLIQDGNEPGRVYCGGSGFSVLSKTNRLTISAITSALSSGGSFSCTIKQELATCECGRKNPTRIHGGEETGVNEYPMMAAVVDLDKKMLICGSTIINFKQVLTAAHCVYSRDPNTVGILVGEHDMNRGNETQDPALLLLADSFTIHELYRPNVPDYDIALVTVKSNFVFNEVVGPICLPFLRRDATFYRDSVDVMGWGAINHAHRPINVLMKASLSVITADECRPSFPLVTGRQMCTQEPNRDSCTFDSGGPLVINSASTRRVVQVGIISRGTACGYGAPALNTRVGAFIDWIQERKPRGIWYCQVE